MGYVQRASDRSFASANGDTYPNLNGDTNGYYALGNAVRSAQRYQCAAFANTHAVCADGDTYARCA